MTVNVGSGRLRFKQELRDFLRFVRRPTLGPRLPGRRPANAVLADWLPDVSYTRLLQWAVFLWVINLFVFGPIAVRAADSLSAQHRLDINNLPWAQILLWAPLIEEMVFRYGLRRIMHALWMTPIAIWIMFQGPHVYSVLLLCALLLVCWKPMLRTSQHHGLRMTTSLPWRRLYRRFFPYFFHGSCLAFALLHLYNFQLLDASWWVLPLLVLPQWATGIVLGWLRVRHGIGASMLLHAMFNAGPLVLIWLITSLMAQAA
jgi:hypothetical protein